jgi:hypothetical protein
MSSGRGQATSYRHPTLALLKKGNTWISANRYASQTCHVVAEFFVGGAIHLAHATRA